MMARRNKIAELNKSVDRMVKSCATKTEKAKHQPDGSRRVRLLKVSRSLEVRAGAHGR